MLFKNEFSVSFNVIVGQPELIGVLLNVAYSFNP